MDSKYTYSQKDLLDNKERYQYTKFEGVSFIDAYIDSRRSAFEYLRDLLLESDVKFFKNDSSVCVCDESLLKPLFVSIKLNCETNLCNNYIQTTSALCVLYQKVASGGTLNCNDDKLIQAYLKRFEVTKRIYSQYSFEGEKLVKKTEEYSELINYVLLSNIFGIVTCKELDRFKRIIYFNTTLKLNDLIVSCIPRIQTTYEAALAYNAIIFEHNIYESCLAEMGI